MPFRNKEQQLLLRKRSRIAAALRETIARKGLTQIQQMCMHEFGLTMLLKMSQQEKEAMVCMVRWKPLMTTEIQRCTSKIDNMVKRQTRQCEMQTKQQEARDYLRDKKGPSRVCGKVQSSMSPEQLNYSMPRGIVWMQKGVTKAGNDLVRSVRSAIPSAEIKRATAAVMSTFIIPAENADKGDALIEKAQRAWRWSIALQKPKASSRSHAESCVAKKG